MSTTITPELLQKGREYKQKYPNAQRSDLATALRIEDMAVVFELFEQTIAAEPETQIPQEQSPDWVEPAHTEMDLATVNPEDLGLDSFDTSNSLVKAIYRAQDGPLPLVPAELKSKKNWVRWKLETVNGRLTKIPYQLNGNKASSADPATWNVFDAVIRGAVIDDTQGVGIMTDGSFIGFDLDGCRNPQTGEITEWVQRIIKTLGTYTEITPSGYGVRVYALGQLPDGARRFSLAVSAGFGEKVGIEAYDENRYFTVTGNRLGKTSVLQSPNVAQAYELCRQVSREFPSDKRKTAVSDSTDHHGSTQIERGPGLVFTSKLALLMYGEIVSRSPFVIQDGHGNKITYASQSEADMALATLLAIKHGDKPELIDTDFRESSLYRPKWDRLAENTIQKAIQLAKQGQKVDRTIEIPATAQNQADIAADVSNQVDGQFPEGEVIPEFEDDLITGQFRPLVDAICNGTTIPRQYAMLATKAVACSILSKHKVVLEDCESARSYFIVFGDTGTGKGLAFRRMQEIVSATQNLEEYVKIIHAVDSEAGLRDAFFEIPLNKNRPILFFIDEVKTLGHKADGRKNPEIVDAIIELANNPTVSRTKSKKTAKADASKSRPDAFLLLFACAQDGEAYATAFPRTKMQGLPDRFIPEFSSKVIPGSLPPVDMALGATAIARLMTNVPSKIEMATGIKARIQEVWEQQEIEFRHSPRLRQQFLLEMYLSAFSRGSAIAETQDLDIAIRTLNRQKSIRRKCFADEIPNQVGVYGNRLKRIHADMLHRLRQGKKIDSVAMSLRDIMTAALAYKENDLPNFNQAWKAQSAFFIECKVTSSKNGHIYKKWVPLPEETDMWLPVELTNGKVLG